MAATNIKVGSCWCERSDWDEKGIETWKLPECLVLLHFSTVQCQQMLLWRCTSECALERQQKVSRTSRLTSDWLSLPNISNFWWSRELQPNARRQIPKRAFCTSTCQKLRRLAALFIPAALKNGLAYKSHTEVRVRCKQPEKNPHFPVRWCQELGCQDVLYRSVESLHWDVIKNLWVCQSLRSWACRSNSKRCLTQLHDQ